MMSAPRGMGYTNYIRHLGLTFLMMIDLPKLSFRCNHFNRDSKLNILSGY